MSDEIEVSRGLARAGHLQLIAALVVRQWEQETLREAGGEDRIDRVRRGAAVILGHPKVRDAPSVSCQPSTQSEKTLSITQNQNRSPRPKLAKKMYDLWETADGKRMLLSLTMRALATQLGISSHTSLYDVPFFVQTILPLRQRGRAGQQAANWIERNARTRP
jgi:hypothetical protein